MMTFIVDIDPLEHFLHLPEEKIEESFGHIPDILVAAYTSTRHTKKLRFKDVLGTAYGYPLHELEAGIDNGVLLYPDSEQKYPIGNFVLASGEYGVVCVFLYQNGLIHVTGEETFTVRLD